MAGRAKKLALGIAGLGLVGAGAIAVTYPGIGNVAYDSVIWVESKRADLHTTPVDVGEQKLVTYQGGPLDAPVVVLLHGYSSERDVWVRFARQLTDDYRVVIPDLAGHGDTGYDPDWDYSIPAQALRVRALLDALDVEQAHIAGNSMGGFIAATFAANYPERTASVGLFDPAGVTEPETSRANELRAERGRPVFVMNDVDEFPAFYDLTMAKPPLLPGFVKDAKAQEYVERRDELQDIFDDFFAQDMLDDRLGEIVDPTLIVWGEQDQLIDISVASLWNEGIEGSQLQVYPEFGHLPMLEDPEETSKRYRAFLEGQ